MNTLNRRHFLRLTGFSLLGFAAAPVANALPLPATHHGIPSQCESKTLNISNIHTGESVQCEFSPEMDNHHDTIVKFNHICRDFRRNEATTMDRKLFDKLAAILEKLGAPDANIKIVSGYRSPATNEMLRKSSNGVAKKSYHMKGQAIDFYVEGIAVSKVHQAAMSLRSGGVGRYRDFVHIDTGPTRAWG